MFPVEILKQTMIDTFVIVCVILLPTASWIGHKMRENTALTIELRRLVNRDRLTYVAAWDFFFAQMDGQPDVYGVSLMVDLERFKSINDRYGHIAGDAVIQGVATALRDNMRPQDLVCRFGGEEFVIFLHEHKRDDGYVAAERLRTAIAATMISLEGGNLNVTVSIGGSLKDRLASIMSVIKDADEALYHAKKMGRNRTIFTPHTTEAEIGTG